ncbi:hypothetical protein [Thiomicrospira sp. WB1]|uniref:hypothetical protein n=1 Tax=Thiomicrospira sp. WB1 TaxID=1685380 RepID=UPI000748F556|nr:hypothetical protein [Thiomicrospira sp. WB1]KUJ71669.1 hypothetical protein AVO41_09150 [Thiomicrospira sp. WB1]
MDFDNLEYEEVEWVKLEMFEFQMMLTFYLDGVFFDGQADKHSLRMAIEALERNFDVIEDDMFFERTLNMIPGEDEYMHLVKDEEAAEYAQKLYSLLKSGLRIKRSGITEVLKGGKS